MSKTIKTTVKVESLTNDDIVVLDYTNGTVHKITTTQHIECFESYLVSLGYDMDQCSWMCGPQIETT